MDLAKYDDLIARILEEEKQIFPFLDIIFGFLWRRTDFFIVQKEGGKLGFPPGGAEKIILSIFRKWQNLSRSSENKTKEYKPEKSCVVQELPECMPIVQEDKKTETLENPKKASTSKIQKPPCDKTKITKTTVSSSDTYNGADRGSYRWCQTIGDIEVLIPVPEYIKKSKEVNISLTDSKVHVKIKDKCDSSKWCTIVDGDLCYKVNKEESVWSLSPGQHISINYEKAEERWWDALLTSEPKLDTKKLDAIKPMSDLSQEEQMKVEEVMWNQERKLLGLKTSEQMRAEKILKDAWNVEGSPFKGTEFDPSVLNLDNKPSNFMDFQ